MCGRTSLFAPADDLESRFDASVPADYRPRYNIAPGEKLAVITSDATDTMQRYTWGLLPYWADKPDEGLINARSETAAEKPAFSDAWESRPCLVLSSGYYEWQDGPRPSQPYRVHREGDPAFAMAGLWQEWDRNGTTLQTVTILTTAANDALASIHDRMPVVLSREDERTWLDGPLDQREALCRPASTTDLTAYPISTRVNDPTNDGPEIIEPADTEQSGLDSFG